MQTVRSLTRRTLLALFTAACMVGPMHASLDARADTPSKSEERTHIEVFTPMRDGVKLAANVFLPAGEGPFPVVLSRTPYLKERTPPTAHQKYTSNGYAYVVQDVRGKGRSEGEYVPFRDDRDDGYDTVEWMAKQSWSNGKVGMTGASALGITANLAASAAPPSLVTAYVVVAPHSQFEEVTFMGGVFKEADTGNWMTRQGAGDQVPPLKKRVIFDDQWAARELPTHIHNIKIPIYNVGGWYDIFNIGNLRNFTYLQTQGARGARGNQKLMMGPFGHGGLSGELEYPAGGDLRTPNASRPDEEMRWFDHWLKGIDNGIMKEPPVRYFRMAAARKGSASAANEWRTAKTWPVRAKDTRYYLHQDMSLSTNKPRDRNAVKTYRFDPSNPVKTFGGANLTIERGPMDQRAIGERQDYLRFMTPPLEEAVEITGPVKAELWVSTDGPDTDFMAKLVDVYPDGYEAVILDAPIRLRYRNGRRSDDQVKMMTPGKAEKVVIDLWATSLLVEKGHRIALHVTSSNNPRFEVNDNNGTPPGEPAKPRVAMNTVHLDRKHPSALVLPVVKN